MRPLALFLLTATPALADTIETAGQVTAVTLYPAGATVTRTLRFSAPAGLHEVIVPGLPPDTTAETLRIRAPAGVAVGATSLATDRQPATADMTSPDVAEAMAEVERLTRVLEDKRRVVAAIRARGEAAQARAAFLQQLAASRVEAADTLPTPEVLKGLAALVGDEVLAAREAQLSAETEAAAADRALQPDLDALARAQAALAALTQPPEDDSPALVMAVQVSAAGEVMLELDWTIMDLAGWLPVYDLRLTRNPAALTIGRGVMVMQDTGEDWRGVDLTLSTAMPGWETAATSLWPQLLRIEPEPPPVAEGDMMRAGAAADGQVEPAMEPAVVVEATNGFDMDLHGQVFTYRFGTPVDIRSGSDRVRLAMDELSAAVRVHAAAVPVFDDTAFLSAEITNTTGQPILPGSAMLYADGALVGAEELDLIPANGEADIGFGPINGLTLTRTVPNRTEGEEGVLTASNRKEETAVITVENLTGETWPVRLTDRVPYSEQDDLEISWEATPMPAERDPKGQRGLLVWEFDVAPGETQQIRLQSRIEWPQGMILR
jgi:uncharacterized protein (TIGR02231 family)